MNLLPVFLSIVTEGNINQIAATAFFITTLLIFWLISALLGAIPLAWRSASFTLGYVDAMASETTDQVAQDEQPVLTPL
jgi:hypothetical protein